MYNNRPIAERKRTKSTEQCEVDLASREKLLIYMESYDIIKSYDNKISIISNVFSIFYTKRDLFHTISVISAKPGVLLYGSTWVCNFLREARSIPRQSCSQCETKSIAYKQLNLIKICSIKCTRCLKIKYYI